MSVSRFRTGPDWRTLPTWQEQAEGCLRQARILPDGEHLYLLDGNTLPESLRTETAYGYCSPVLDLLLRPHVANWQGRGAGVVVFPNQFNHINELVLTVTHEYCHWLEYAVVCARAGMVELVTHSPANMRPALREAMTLALDSFDVDTNVAAPQEDPHNVTWHWLMAHAAYRLWQFADVFAAYQGLHWANDYGHASKVAFMQAAGDLPATLADRPLLSLAGLAPESFIGLFKKGKGNG